MILKADEFVYNKLQQVYNYVLDTCGVMKGTLMFIFISITAAEMFSLYLLKSSVFLLFGLLPCFILAVLSVRCRSLQISKNFTFVNRVAEITRNPILLLPKTIMMLDIVACFFKNLPTSEFASVIILDTSLIVFTYVMGLYVRDPEERRETKMSFQGA